MRWTKRLYVNAQARLRVKGEEVGQGSELANEFLTAGGQSYDGSKVAGARITEQL